jgi:hypothetical protein
MKTAVFRDVTPLPPSSTIKMEKTVSSETLANILYQIIRDHTPRGQYSIVATVKMANLTQPQQSKFTQQLRR